MSLSCLQTRSYPFLGRKYLFNDLYSTHGPPLCRFLLAAQFADVIEGACRLPPLRPLLCNYQTIYQTWQAIRKPDKARCVAFKFCTRPGHLASGLQKVGGSESRLPLPCCCWVRKALQLLIVMEQYLFSCFIYPFCSFVWYDSKCKLVCFNI